MSQIIHTLIRTKPRIVKEVCALPEHLRQLCDYGCIIRQSPNIPQCLYSKMDMCASICKDTRTQCRCKKIEK